MTDDLAKEILEQIGHLDRKLIAHMQKEYEMGAKLAGGD